MAHPIRVEPVDEWNKQLVANVHPSTWQNPVPDGRYNLVVVGAGTGGLITALIASSLGAKVALIERHLMGGDCLNVGCVPSKAVIRGAAIVHEAREAARFGMPASDSDLGDFGEVLTERDYGYLPPEKVVCLCTGSQGEMRAALSRIADGTHPNITLNDGDMVIFSSRTIPGNETRVHKLQNQLARIGAHVLSGENAKVHV